MIAFWVGTSTTFAQDSSSVKTDVGIATRNIWRGLDYGSSPSAWGDIYWEQEKFSVGAMGTTTLNGSKAQYGTWMELYLTLELTEKLSLTFDDYFFFNSTDSMNNYFDYSKDKTQHMMEARLEYENEKLEAFIGYVIYGNETDTTSGVYLEATFQPTKYISFTGGFLTDAQWLSFYDAGGMTTFAINGHKETGIGDLKASLILNPNYKNASPAVGNNPAYFVLSLDF